MCGICGQFNYIDHQPVHLNDIKRMADTIKHRGPDDEGYYLSESLGLGFRRLSIIDLSGGHQPMSDHDESIWIVFNGEIYNFQQLRSELQNRGHVFKTNSDTEVIIHGYKEWGEDVLNHLNGMFGLAIWDVLDRKLLIARDPMGIKLIYYTLENGTLYFSSEIKPILTQTKKDIDSTSLNLFLRYRFTPSPLTIFKDIYKLAAGSKIVVKNGHVHIDRWHQDHSSCDVYSNDKEVEDKLASLYEDAIQRQLISDVPVGLLLSGGLDSGLLLALMKKYGDNWPTYTVGFGESFHDDELKDAAETANYFGVDNHQSLLDKDGFEKSLQHIISVLEEPVASPSVVGMYHVCARAKQDVKVLLMGQGPDELLGGYKRHLGVHYGHYWRDLPDWCRGILNTAFSSLPRNETLKRALYSLDVPDRMRRYQQVLSIIENQKVDHLFHHGMIPLDCGDKILECWKELEVGLLEKDELGGFQYLEVRSTLPDELLMYADKISMAHSLEVRVPYLDLEIVKFIENLPANYKVRNGKRKWLHRQVCKQYMPKKFIQRRKKGFAVNVVDDWYRESMKGKVRDTLLDESSLIYNYLVPAEVNSLVKDHANGINDNHKIIYSLIVFEEWLRHFKNG